MGQLITAVVAIAVTVFTFQYEALPEIAAAVEGSGDIAVSSSALLSTPGAYSAAVASLPASTLAEAGAISAAAGNIAGQLAGNATGIQHGFSARSLAASTIT